jgi:hypothetical protein
MLPAKISSKPAATWVSNQLGRKLHLSAAPAQGWNGAVAQMGERVVRNDEVRGSIPLGSTSVLNCHILVCKRQPSALPVLTLQTRPIVLSLSKDALRFSNATIFGSS